MWFNAKAPGPAVSDSYTRFSQFETFSDLADLMNAGKRVRAITISGIASDWENLEKCRDLQSVRILLPPGREAYLDSALTHMKRLPVQHLDIGYSQTYSRESVLTKHNNTASVHQLPASIKQLGLLKKITL
ncbi:hypothetical protein, partial [Arsenicibacter rosenii]|uniref:hypothetical protein n=1 Tax=Arsenicibacter rosenii TaxID=1750698 RepID=UPI001C431DBF